MARGGGRLGGGQPPRRRHDLPGHEVSGTVLDLGAAEGLFSLRAVDRAAALVLFECDDGWIEVEIFSQRNWWKRDADEVVEVIRDRIETAT